MQNEVIVYVDPMPEWTQRQLLYDLLPPGFELRYTDARNQDELNAMLADCTYCITGWSAGKIDREFLLMAPKIRFIQMMGVGFENVNLNDLKAGGVSISNTAGVNASAVAEHAVMLLLAFLKRLVFAHSQLSQGNWAYAALQDMGLEELQGKTVGIVGYGRIGREIAKRLLAFNVRLLYSDMVRNAEDEENMPLTYCEMDQLLEISDAVILQVSLTEKTRHLISRRELGLMKSSAVLINTARGQVVDQEALITAIEKGEIAGACLDCFDQEPLSHDNPLLRCKGLLMTPHIAGASSPVFRRSLQLAYDNILRVKKGENPINALIG